MARYNPGRDSEGVSWIEQLANGQLADTGNLNQIIQNGQVWERYEGPTSLYGGQDIHSQAQNINGQWYLPSNAMGAFRGVVPFEESMLDSMGAGILALPVAGFFAAGGAAALGAAAGGAGATEASAGGAVGGAEGIAGGAGGAMDMGIGTAEVAGLYGVGPQAAGSWLTPQNLRTASSLVNQFAGGGGGGGGGMAGPTSTSVQNYTPEEQAQRQALMAEVMRIYGQQTAGGTPGYPGAQPVGFSPNTLMSRQLAEQYAMGQGGDLGTTAANYSQFMMGPAQYAESNPYLQSAIGAATRPITQAYSGAGGVLSQIRGGSVGAGQYGSSRQGVAEGLAAQGYQQSVADTAANMSNANYQASQANAMRALALGQQTQQMGMMPAQVMGQLGMQEELLSQDQEQYAAKSREWQMNAPWTPLQNYANLVYGAGSGGSTGTATYQQPNRFNTALGGAATGASIGSMIPGVGAGIGAGIGVLAGLFG